MKLGEFFFFSAVVHTVLFYSVFDIYFTSPIIHGINPIEPKNASPAKRLVLFVADGLRADKFYEADKVTGKYRNPYLRLFILTPKVCFFINKISFSFEVIFIDKGIITTKIDK